MRKAWLRVVLLVPLALFAGCGPTTAPASPSSAPTPTSPSTSLPAWPAPDSAAAAEALNSAISVPGAPAGVGVAFGSVWVISHRGGNVYRVDPEQGAIQAVINVGGRQCGQPSFSDSLVWISMCGLSTIRVDPTSNSVVGSTDWGGLSTAFGDASVWAVIGDGSRVGRFDEASLEQVAEIDIGSLGDYVAYGFGSVWVSSVKDGVVSRIDPASNEVTAVIPVGPPGITGSGVLAVGSDRVWVTSLGDGSVYQIDPDTDAARQVNLGARPASGFFEMYIVVTDDGVWVRPRDDTVIQVDSNSGSLIASYPAGRGGGGMAVGFGSLWVANFSDGTLWRVPLSE